MSTSPVKLLFNSYQMLKPKEKEELFKLIEEEQGQERMDKLISGIEVENMTQKEKWVLKIARDLRVNAFYFKS